jgi:hypothetical protein
MKRIARGISETRTSVNLNVFRRSDANQPHTVINVWYGADESYDVVHIALSEITSIVVHRISNGIADNRRLPFDNRRRQHNERYDMQRVHLTRKR